MSKLSSAVRAFHERFGHPVADRPTIPNGEQIRFRLKLITEEFFEVITACFRGGPIELGLDALETKVRMVIDSAAIGVNLPEFIDGTVDLDWVVEGTRLVFGVDADPAIDEVARANMSKDRVYVWVKDAYHHGSAGGGDEWNEVPDPKAKPTKPAGWRPPDMIRVLREQGYVSEPTSTRVDGNAADPEPPWNIEHMPGDAQMPEMWRAACVGLWRQTRAAACRDREKWSNSSLGEVAGLEEQRDELEEQRDELQARCTDLENERRMWKGRAEAQRLAITALTDFLCGLVTPKTEGDNVAAQSFVKDATEKIGELARRNEQLAADAWTKAAQAARSFVEKVDSREPTIDWSIAVHAWSEIFKQALGR